MADSLVYCPSRRHSVECAGKEASLQRAVWLRDGCDLCRAELIAAAPDLLEAAEQVVRAHEDLTLDDVEIAALRAAVARARGGGA